MFRYLLVGGSTAFLYFGVTVGFVEGAAMNATLASTIACIAAVCYNYLLHYHWTFSTEAPHGKVIVRYVMMYVGAIIVNGLLMHLGTSILSLHYFYSQMLAAAGVGAWSLGLSAIWVYRHG